jgi:hypothetical protein
VVYQAGAIEIFESPSLAVEAEEAMADDCGWPDFLLRAFLG